MKKPSNVRELEEMIRRFYRVDRLLPPVLPKRPQSELARFIIIPDNARSPEDVLCDIDNTLCPEDLKVWDNVGRWLSEVPWCLDKQIVCLRCQGKSWRRIAKELKCRRTITRCFHRSTLLRHFHKGLGKILMMVKQYPNDKVY